MSAPRHLRAVVVGRQDYGEADRILRLLTGELGRVSVLARHARKSRKRFGGRLDLGNVLEVGLKRGRGELYLLTDCELVAGHPHLRSDLYRISLAGYACELCGGLAQEDRPEPRLFGLLEVALLVLEACTEGPALGFRAGLEAKALTFAGLTPALERCAVCDEALEAPLAWSPSAGGAVHRHCGEGEGVELAWVQAVERARRTPLRELVDQGLPFGPLWGLHELLAWQVGRPLKSAEVLSAVEAVPGSTG